MYKNIFKRMHNMTDGSDFQTFTVGGSPLINVCYCSTGMNYRVSTDSGAGGVRGSWARASFVTVNISCFKVEDLS